MLLAAGPNWLGSLSTRRSTRSLPLAVGVVCASEIVLELVEYPTMYADKFHYSAYYDTPADMANSIVGAVIGAAVAVVLARRLAR